MLYLGIDLHSKQLTVNLRGEDGEVMMRRQVSTRGEEPRNFLAEVARLAGDGGYISILEVCGFHDWFTELLPPCGCREVVLVQAEKRCSRKTDTSRGLNTSARASRAMTGSFVSGPYEHCCDREQADSTHPYRTLSSAAIRKPVIFFCRTPKARWPPACPIVTMSSNKCCLVRSMRGSVRLSNFVRIATMLERATSKTAVKTRKPRANLSLT